MTMPTYPFSFNENNQEYEDNYHVNEYNISTDSIDFTFSIDDGIFSFYGNADLDTQTMSQKQKHEAILALNSINDKIQNIITQLSE